MLCSPTSLCRISLHSQPGVELAVPLLLSNTNPSPESPFSLLPQLTAQVPDPKQGQRQNQPAAPQREAHNALWQPAPTKAPRPSPPFPFPASRTNKRTQNLLRVKAGASIRGIIPGELAQHGTPSPCESEIPPFVSPSCAVPPSDHSQELSHHKQSG